MAIAKKKDEASLGAAMLSANLYKRSQGRLVRQLTAAAVALIFCLGAWRLGQGPLSDAGDAVQWGIPLAIATAGVWFAYRLVNYPKFADFLISVEAEMDKVSWPSWPELWRSALVVVATMFCLGVVLLGFDMFWHWFFTLIKFLRVQ
jgi:preprotein translocase subunit SecE